MAEDRGITTRIEEGLDSLFSTLLSLETGPLVVTGLEAITRRL
jgi:hypothetical protein